MKYRDFIQEYFLIDHPDGRKVPFVFNEVQNAYYDDLQREYNIEEHGTNVPIRENILKARREGFSSLIEGLFAADDLMTLDALETTVLSYRDKDTETFRRRYRNYILSYHAISKFGWTKEQVAENFTELEKLAKHVFFRDTTDIILANNKAHFQCDTAGARTGGRGGVLQKLHFSEIAFYQDTEKISATKLIEATMRQVDLGAGWIFMESTENGPGTYQHRQWMQAKRGESRFRNRFYGWTFFYTPAQFRLIESEYVDKDALRRDYPKTEDDLFKGSKRTFTSDEALEALIEVESAKKEIVFWMQLEGTNYIDQAEMLHTTLETLEKEHAGHSLYVGIDVAKTRDATVLTVVRDKRRDLKGGIKCVTIDATGIGDYLPDWFENNSRFYVLKVKFSRPSKDVMYKNLQTVIAKKLTALPVLKQGGEAVSEEAKEFRRQMLELEKEQIGYMLVVHHPKDDEDHDTYADGFHDDYPDSWTLAEHGYIHINGMPKLEKPTKPATVENAVESLLNKGTKRDKVRYRTDHGSHFE